ncbi:cytochrome P450 [Mytilinidion resinicola]|uniref:Cytochrome P450 n=1 Tax=Mytilinidion resinicola TaxID=574789 RepID=A0A6A6YTI5_9PEZI|nr:cytochrome P450 [Mytilinidion resinicola]KAF2812081.1 cytochrome P450 [Mytilinidion resinicola]
MSIPGPRSTLPYIGRFHDVDRNNPSRSMKKLSDQYGGLFSMTLSGETHIWVGRSDIAFDLLCKNAAICSGRADLGAYPGVTKDSGTFLYLENLVRQRKFTHTVILRNVTSNFSGYITLEAKRYFYNLLARPSDFHYESYLFCARVTARLSYGSPGSAEAHLRNSREFIHQLSPSGPITNMIPALGYLPEWLVPSKREVRVRQRREAKLWIGLYKKAEQTYEEGGAPFTYVSAYLDSKREGGKNQLFDDEMEAIYTIGMVGTVAIVTIAGALTLFIMAMILHPEWQDKVREIDAESGDRLVELSDAPRLPTLWVAIKEYLRWKPTVPLEEDYSYDGYHFPNTLLFTSLTLPFPANQTGIKMPRVITRVDGWAKSLLGPRDLWRNIFD